MRLTSRSIRIGFPAEDGRLWLNMRMFLDGTTGFASLNRPAVQPVVEGSDGHYPISLKTGEMNHRLYMTVAS